MADRVEAFAAWRRGKITDDDLKQVVVDLEMVIDVFHAMEERGLILRGLRREFEVAKYMYEERRKPT